MTDKLPLEGKYLMYRGKPLVRENNVIVYGDMDDPYYLFLMILSEKEEDGKTLPDRILIQIVSTKDGSIFKMGEKSGLFDAVDIGMIWLERALADQ